MQGNLFRNAYHDVQHKVLQYLANQLQHMLHSKSIDDDGAEVQDNVVDNSDVVTDHVHDQKYIIAAADVHNYVSDVFKCLTQGDVLNAQVFQDIARHDHRQVDVFQDVAQLSALNLST